MAVFPVVDPGTGVQMSLEELIILLEVGQHFVLAECPELACLVVLRLVNVFE